MESVELRGKVILKQQSGLDGVSMFDYFMSENIYSRSENKTIEVLNRLFFELSNIINTNDKEHIKKVGMYNEVVICFVK